jgi:hypothetical protein
MTLRRGAMRVALVSVVIGSGLVSYDAIATRVSAAQGQWCNCNVDIDCSDSGTQYCDGVAQCTPSEDPCPGGGTCTGLCKPIPSPTPRY